MVNKIMRKLRNGIAIVLAVLCAGTVHGQVKLWHSEAYTLYSDRVVQQKYSARAISREEIVSNYQSPASTYKTSVITFKFSINGKDNEMVSGSDHHFSYDTEKKYAETPLITFGRQLKSMGSGKTCCLKPGARLKVRLDMRHVLHGFNTKGFYTTFDGGRIYKEDFRGVYIAGNPAPLIWDFDNLVHHPELELKDEDKDGIYEIVLDLNVQEANNKLLTRWKLDKELSAFPRYRSPHPLPDALYNMALEEMIKAVEPDSTFRTGQEWAGVWTRDISYSIILSMAHLQPQVARYSLLRKVNKKKKIIQDTGTGGAWPVSTDRMIWAVAAWELYKVTGDDQWLEEAYEVIKNSIYDDMLTVYDSTTGLVKGESSFLDWREQTYPVWMQPADIFESLNLGTNAVHYQANRVAASMAALLADDDAAQLFNKNAERIRSAVNDRLWRKGKNYYGQYLYGRSYKTVSPRAEALGASLCVIFGIADAQRSRLLVQNMPVTPYGIPCIYPQIPLVPPYHNNGVWPFVQSFWMWAGAMAGNERSVMESIAAIYRPAALFATNKENFVAENGDHAGTQINSSNMLWSLSGNISIVHRVLFGMQFEHDRLLFRPFVPAALKGRRTLENFRYRNAVLNISLEGYGDQIDSFFVDGLPAAGFSFPANKSGAHTLRIVLRNGFGRSLAMNHQPVTFSPATPELTYKGNMLSWKAVEGAEKYRLLVNGIVLAETSHLSYPIVAGAYKECQLIAVAKNGMESFASEPLAIVDAADVLIYEPEDQLAPANYPYKGYSGKGFVETSTDVNTRVDIEVRVTKSGVYLLDMRYANGNGPVNTDNKCAIRTLSVDGRRIAPFVFPQRGKGEWSEWGWSNALKVWLAEGKHTIRIEYQASDENMDMENNQAMLDQFRLRRIK